MADQDPLQALEVEELEKQWQRGEPSTSSTSDYRERRRLVWQRMRDDMLRGALRPSFVIFDECSPWPPASYAGLESNANQIQPRPRSGPDWNELLVPRPPGWNLEAHALLQEGVSRFMADHYLEVRCCCRPQKLLGWMPIGEHQRVVPGGAMTFVLGRPFVMPSDGFGDQRPHTETITLPVSEWRDGWRRGFALKSEETPLEDLRRVRGFVERT